MTVEDLKNAIFPIAFWCPVLGEYSAVGLALAVRVHKRG
jgi:hypothetical protein